MSPLLGVRQGRVRATREHRREGGEGEGEGEAASGQGVSLATTSSPLLTTLPPLMVKLLTL